MPDYQKAKIYAIMSPHTTDVYIGSTCQELNDRYAKHKYDSKSNNCTSNKIINFGDAYIHLVEEYPCNTQQELFIKEGEYIRNTLFCINRQVAGRTNKEYYQDNIERIRKRHNDYDMLHKKEALERSRKHRAKKKLTLS
jgi:hypothetical protein